MKKKLNQAPALRHPRVGRLKELVGKEREIVVSFLIELAGVEDVKLALELGYPSTYELLTKVLHLPESSARRRVTASKLLSRYPVIAGYLLSGALNLTTLCELACIITPENVEDLLERASGLSKAAVRLLVANHRAASATGTRALPLPAPPVATPVAAAAAATPVATPPPPASPPASESPELHRLQMIVPKELIDDLEEVKALLSHKTSGDTVAALHEALRIAKAALLKKKLGCGRARPGHIPADDSRNIPSAVKVAVWDRDGGRCTFVGAGGHVCGSTFQVQFHHIEPFGRGGPSTVANVTLRCSAHNQLAAEQDFGRVHIERRRVESDAQSALVNMGFKKEESRKAVAHARSNHPAAPLPELLREALRVLTRPPAAVG